MFDQATLMLCISSGGQTVNSNGIPKSTTWWSIIWWHFYTKFANYALRRTAKDNLGDFDQETIDTVLRYFYIDDCLKSSDYENKAIPLAHQVQVQVHTSFIGMLLIYKVNCQSNI